MALSDVVLFAEYDDIMPDEYDQLPDEFRELFEMHDQQSQAHESVETTIRAMIGYERVAGRDGPVTFLEEFAGYLQADAFAGYDGIYAPKTGNDFRLARKKYSFTDIRDLASVATTSSILISVRELVRAARSTALQSRR